MIAWVGIGVCGAAFVALVVTVIVRGLPLGDQLASVISACAALIGVVISLGFLFKPAQGGGATAVGPDSVAVSGESVGSAFGPDARHSGPHPTATPSGPAGPAGPARAEGGGTAVTGRHEGSAFGKGAVSE
ncbi:hypothetical protein ACWGVR_10020 [Streptomyces xanthophaeus]